MQASMAGQSARKTRPTALVRRWLRVQAAIVILASRRTERSPMGTTKAKPNSGSQGVTAPRPGRSGRSARLGSMRVLIPDRCSAGGLEAFKKSFAA
jgi:hypothetical protein